MLIPSVLIDAQMGRAVTVTAGPCALRGLRTAQVVPASHPGTRFAAGASLLNGASALDDKVADGDLPTWTTSLGRRVVDRVTAGARRQGRRLTDESAFDADPFAGAAQAAAAVEGTGRTLADFLAPAGRAGGALFAHTRSWPDGWATKGLSAGPVTRSAGLCTSSMPSTTIRATPPPGPSTR